MRRKTILAGAAVIAFLVSLVVAMMLVVAPSPFPPVTVRYVTSVQSGKWVKATFEITNHTPTFFRPNDLLLQLSAHEERSGRGTITYS